MRTVAGVLEAALSRLLSEPVKVSGAGRTDSGVHATGQVVSFSTSARFPFERLCIAVNSALPDDLSVREAAVVDVDFSARFAAIERSYVYAIFNRSMPSALLARQAYHVWLPLDVEPMIAAARQFVGEHDFRSLCGMLPEGGITIRTVRRLSIEVRDELLRLEICADGFLHRMVRTIVGTLVECAAGRRDPSTIEEVLGARDRRVAGHTAPPHGLYLAGVKYDGYDSYREPPLFGLSARSDFA